jgi:hypothetical protein
MKNRFYLACFRDNVGSNVAFHGISGCGYPTDVNKAQTYTLEEAQKAWDGGREYDQPISADHVDSMLVSKVDCQKLPTETTKVPNCNKYVAYQRGNWDGNDVYWLTSKQNSVNFADATIYTADDVDDNSEVVYLPFDMVDKLKRSTFAFSNYNRRSMVQGAGLRTPKHLKLSRRRKNNPKTRWNCPACGKLHWQHNPHDFGGCNDILCEEHPYSHANSRFLSPYD